MEWYQYLAGFFAGAFLANVVPHYVHGISGNKFPSPFANPSGIGLSSPTLNIAWALFNLLAGYGLYVVSHIDKDNPLSMLPFFAGIAVMGLCLSVWFTRKHKD